MCALIRFCYNSFWWIKFINRLAVAKCLAFSCWLLAVNPAAQAFPPPC